MTKSGSLSFLVAGAALALATLEAGCGSDGNGTSPFEEFLGIWQIDPAFDTAGNSSTFGATCAMAPAQDVPFMTVVQFDPGTLSDLIDIAGCVMTYDVSGKVATPQSKNPFANPPSTSRQLCDVPAGDGVTTFEVTPQPSWQFNLLAPVKGESPKAEIVGTAMMTVFQTNTAGQNVVVDTCTLTAQPAKFFKIANR